MDFSDALRIVMNGGRVRRSLWAELDGRTGAYLDLKVLPYVGDVLICPLPDGTEKLFACSQWDILATDWEIA